jgi:hypothetical protein
MVYATLRASARKWLRSSGQLILDRSFTHLFCVALAHGREELSRSSRFAYATLESQTGRRCGCVRSLLLHSSARPPMLAQPRITRSHTGSVGLLASLAAMFVGRRRLRRV